MLSNGGFKRNALIIDMINIYKNTCFDKCINWLLDFHYDTPSKLTQGYTSDPKVIKSPMILKRK